MASTSSSGGHDLVVGASVDPSGKRAEWIEPKDGAPAVVMTPLELDAHAPARLLVVEDAHLVALDIQQHMMRLGHEVVVAPSGKEAIERASGEHFDLVLVDIRLGGDIDGIAAASAIRTASDLPIVYLTPFADNETLERARRTEPYGYVLEPFQDRELEAAVDVALQRHRGDKLRAEQDIMQRFLADATARMSATLDYRAVARGASELLVPRYADWCEIHLKHTDDVTPPFSLSRPNGNHDHGGKTPQLLAAVLDSGRSEIITQISGPDVLRDALGAEHVGALYELGARSVVCVPLLARDHVVGALAMVTGRNRARYTEHDLAFAEDFGQRLGVALDNALLYRKAEHAIAMRDDVVAIVSHDLRTPLGAILMQAELIADSADHRKAGTEIVRAARRINRLIGDLLDASAIDAGQLRLDAAIHSAASIAREALEMYRSHAEARDIHLVDTLDETADITCDRDRLVQVLSNLLANAVKFTPRGGIVTVAAVRDDAHVRFEVRDTGRGIAAERLPSLFTRVWHAHVDRTGATLGLFIARGIVDAHGSALEVESAEGAGARFFFRLPAAAKPG